MTVDYQQQPIHFDIHGSGNPVVLLHGFLENSKIWDSLISVFEKNFQVIAIDLFGHGKTPVVSETHTMEAMAEAVGCVLDYLKIDKTALIGHSMGGYVSLAFLEKYPEKVERICLLNSSPLPDSESRQNSRDQIVKTVDTHKEEFVQEEITRLFAENNRAIFTDQLNPKIDEAKKLSAESIKASARGMKIRPERTGILKNFEGKKWIVTGEEDPIIPYPSIVKVAEATHTKLVALSGGHMSYIEDSRAVKDALQQFLGH